MGALTFCVSFFIYFFLKFKLCPAYCVIMWEINNFWCNQIGDTISYPILWLEFSPVCFHNLQFHKHGMLQSFCLKLMLMIKISLLKILFHECEHNDFIEVWISVVPLFVSTFQWITTSFGSVGPSGQWSWNLVKQTVHYGTHVLLLSFALSFSFPCLCIATNVICE